MQLRRSPGGSMLKSLRSRPEEPPSSVTATTAARSEMRPASRSSSLGTVTWRRSPRSSVDRPVPPPRATTRSGRVDSPPLQAVSKPKSSSSCRSMGALGYLGIQQLGKPGIVHHALKVVVNARLQPVPGVQFDRPGKVPQAVLRPPRHRIQQRQPVKSVISS